MNECNGIMEVGWEGTCACECVYVYDRRGHGNRLWVTQGGGAKHF